MTDAPRRAGTVVVVDDEPDIREMIRHILERHGHRVLTAASGEQALERLRGAERPCLVLLDVMMPGMSGQEFRTRQLADPELAPVPVVLLSGDPELVTRARIMGLSGHLRKPIELKDLVATVERYCGRPDVERA